MPLAQVEANFGWLFDLHAPISDYLICGVVRNPLDWLISLYRSHKSEAFRPYDNLYTGGMDFAEFYEVWRPRNANQTEPVARRLKGRTVTANRILRFDSLERHVAALCHDLDIPKPELRRLNASPRNAERPRVGEDLMHRISQDYAEDFALWRGEWACAA